MSRERFEELKATAEGHIKHKDARALELQQIISDSSIQITTNLQKKDDAEAVNDPEAYAQACTLISMYSDRKRKAEDEQNRGAWEPTIPADLYEAIRNFLQAESEQLAIEEMRDIKAHLEEAQAIVERAQAYTQELNIFAHECERLNRASYTGDYRFMNVGHMPEALADELKSLLYHFNRMAH